MDRRNDRRGLQPLARILDDTLRACGLQERSEERAALSGWTQIVGAEIAAHARAIDLADGVLTLEADHGAWRQEVTMLIPMIVRKFNARYGEGTVTDVQWRDRPRRGRRPVRKS